MIFIHKIKFLMHIYIQSNHQVTLLVISAIMQLKE